MFYCDECAKKHDWPITPFKSKGACEICREMAVCNDLPSRHLPPSRKDIEDDKPPKQKRHRFDLD